MDMPKFHETFIPILDVLSSGKSIHYKDMRRLVYERHYAKMPDEVMTQKVKDGTPLLFNRIGWAKSYLKQGGYLTQPSRGLVQITDKGCKALERGSFTFHDLKKDPEYVAAQLEKTSEKASSPESDTSFEGMTPQDLIDKGIRDLESEVKLQILGMVKASDPFYFERIVLILLARMGYGDTIETKKSGDGGIDGIINQDKLGLDKIYIQAKRYADNKVRETDIRNFIGAMSGDTSKGVFVTTSSFDVHAVEKARDAHHKIILIDGRKLADLMYEYGVGLQIKETYEVKEIDENFYDEG